MMILPGRAKAGAAAKFDALSFDYFRYVKQQSLFPKIALFAAALSGVAGWMALDDVRLLKMAAVAFGYFLLLMIWNAVVGFRVSNGYFGTTESEVRDFIKFIVEHREDIDFTDQSGKRRRSLVPESQQPKQAARTAPGVLPE